MARRLATKGTKITKERHKESFVSFVRFVANVFVGFVAAAAMACASPPEFDLVIRGGDVFDGSGQPSQKADVGIKGDRITAIGNLADRCFAYAHQRHAAVERSHQTSAQRGWTCGFTHERGHRPRAKDTADSADSRHDSSRYVSE